VVSAWLGHSDVNLTVKRYGRWSSEAREQWSWIKKLDKLIDSVAKGPWLTVYEGAQRWNRKVDASRSTRGVVTL
jgi:hypothetical protein